MNKKENKESQELQFTLEATSDIMFDRFYGQEADTRPPEQKLYLDDNKQVVLPSENVYTFLFGENPMGAIRMTEGKMSKEFLRWGPSCVFISPALIPFTREGKPIVFEGFDPDLIYVSEFAPRVRKGNLSIKSNVKPRPVLKAPWSLSFTINLWKNPKITEDKLANWFADGGIRVALGTYRPRFGRFTSSYVEV